MSAITKALIPCGGRGTRMRALTGGEPKELVPVAGVPALVHVVRECAASGIEDVLIITAPDKGALEDALRARGGAPDMPRRVDFLLQRDPRGLADALRLGREFATGGPLAVALPDNLFAGEQPGLAEVLDSFARHRTSVIAVVEISDAVLRRRGPTAIFTGQLSGDDFWITAISEKTLRPDSFDLRGAPRVCTGVGRYVFTPELFQAIEEVDRSLPPGAELDDVPALQRLLGRGRLMGRRMRGRYFDIGYPEGYRTADTFLRAQAGDAVR